MKKRFSSLLFVGAFLALCLLPTAGLLLWGASETVANEPPAAAPSFQKWDGSFNPDVLSDLADWLGQRFALRQEAITLWARLNAKVFRTSVTDSVLLGKNGWLYYEPTRADYTGSEPMTERELWCAARTLYLLQTYAEEQGADFLFAVAPNKNSLYAENMPALTRLDTPTNAERLSALLSEMGVQTADLFDAFNGQEEALYYPTDSHWNGRGAALAADAILSALGRESGYFAGDFTAAAHRGDLYEMLYPAGKDTDPDYVYTGFSFTADKDDPNAMSINTQSAAGAGRLLCYRDSFGRNLYPYLAQSFAEAGFSRKNTYDPTSLSAGDTMVVELVERNLRYLLQYDPVFPSPTAEAVKPARTENAGLYLTLAKGAPAGYNALHGVFGALTPDEDSPVIVIAGELGAANQYYEALPRTEGFLVCLPEGWAQGTFRVAFRVNGAWITQPGVLQS